MDKPLGIGEFHALLTSEGNDSPMLRSLRKLMTIEKPAEIARLAAEPLQNWMGWGG